MGQTSPHDDENALTLWVGILLASLALLLDGCAGKTVDPRLSPVAGNRESAALTMTPEDARARAEELRRLMAQDPEPGVRRAATWALGNAAHDEGSIPAFAGALRTEQTREVRIALLAALCSFDNAASIDALVGLWMDWP